MTLLGNRRWRAAFVTLALLAVFVSGTVVWRASHALHNAQEEISARGKFRFAVRNVEPTKGSAFEWISAPAVFSNAARFNDKLYVSGPAGLFEYDSRGGLLKSYLVGRELPPSPLGQMTRAVLVDTREPELLIATESEGVLAFNGRSFRQIRPEDAAARSLTSILPLSSGHLLIGTQKRGVLVYDGHELAVLHKTLADVHVTALAGSDSDLWVGTRDRGVLHFHAGQTDTFGEAEGLPDAQVHAIAIAGDKTYVGTSVGVAEFSGGKLQYVLARGAFARALLPLVDSLLVGTMDQGIADIPLQRARLVNATLHHSSEPAETEQLFESDGTVYAVARDGLYRSSGGAWLRVLSQQGAVLSDRNVSALSLDGSGRLWVGYFDRGLDIVSADGKRTQHVEDDRVFCVNRILPQASGVYVATANGLVMFDYSGNQQQVLRHSDGLIADHVTDIVPYRAGVAIATPAGLTFLDGSGARSLYAFHGLVNNHVYALGVSGDRLLAGTLGGLSVLDEEKITTSFTAASSGLKHNWITAVVPLGNEWIVGTYGAGLMRLDSEGRFQKFDIANGNFEVNPNALLATGKHVFAGTLGRGLYVYDRERQRWSVVREGLPSENVTALAERGGYVYVGTDNGLVRVAEQNFR